MSEPMDVDSASVQTGVVQGAPARENQPKEEKKPTEIKDPDWLVKRVENIKPEEKREEHKVKPEGEKSEKKEEHKVKSEGERSEKKHKHKHKHKSHDHDKEKHKSHHDKSHKSHHHDKEKQKSGHHHHHKAKLPDPSFGKSGSSLLSSAKDATDISRMLAEPIDREIVSDDFQIMKQKSMKDGTPVTPPAKRSRKSDGVPIPGMSIDVDKRFLKPFNEGWKREIVLRNPANEMVEATGSKPKADIYYYAPLGKKLRSMREIEDYIEKNRSTVGDVTVNNFTWMKGAIYSAPDEIVRTAAAGRGKPFGGGGTPTVGKMHRDDPNWEKAKKKIKQAKISPGGPMLKSPSGKLPVKFNFPRAPIDPLKQVAKKGSGGVKGPGVMGVISKGVAKKSTGKKKFSSELKRPSQRLCGLTCPGQDGVPPSIQCGICMCLFHPSCVGHTGEVPSMYICPACSTPPKPKNGTDGAQNNGGIVNGAETKTLTAQAIPPNAMSNMHGSSPISGQLLTLPSSVLSRVCSQQPLSLKVNNQKLVIPPNCFLSTPEGVKVFLPAGTLPSSIVNSENKAANVKLSVNKEQNQQDISLLTDDENSKGSSGGSLVSETLLPTDDTCYFEKLQISVDVILNVFRFLPQSDLLRAAQVCQMWKKVAEHQTLWKIVRLRKTRVSQWEEAVKSLTKYGTKTLDLRGMLFYEDKNRTWHQLTSVLHQMTEVRRMYFCQSPAHMLHIIADRLQDLEGLVAERVFDADQTYKPTIMQTTKLDVGKLSKLTQLTELKVRSPHGLALPPVSFSDGLQGLSNLKKLKTLSVTTLREVPAEQFGFVSNLSALEDLELGDCLTFTEETYEAIGKLTSLRRMRLECGGQDMDGPLSNALKQLQSLERLDLVRYQIGPKIKDALNTLEKLQKLTIWPDGGNQAAAVNTNTLNAVKDLTRLNALDWGIMIDDGTSIILAEDDDGIDPAEKAIKFDTEKKTECIPFLPHKDQNAETEGGSGDVDLMPEYTSIAQLVEKLCGFLPDTKVRVFRIPVLNAVPVVNAFAS